MDILKIWHAYASPGPRLGSPALKGHHIQVPVQHSGMYIRHKPNHRPDSLKRVLWSQSVARFFHWLTAEWTLSSRKGHLCLKRRLRAQCQSRLGPIDIAWYLTAYQSLFAPFLPVCPFSLHYTNTTNLPRMHLDHMSITWYCQKQQPVGGAMIKK